jgi:hypothetical protein
MDMAHRASAEAEFHMDSVWNGIVDGLLEWHATEARDWRSANEKVTLRRLRHALKERGFSNPVEAFVFFDMHGKGALSWLEVRRRLQRPTCELHNN